MKEDDSYKKFYENLNYKFNKKEEFSFNCKGTDYALIGLNLLINNSNDLNIYSDGINFISTVICYNSRWNYFPDWMSETMKVFYHCKNNINVRLILKDSDSYNSFNLMIPISEKNYINSIKILDENLLKKDDSLYLYCYSNSSKISIIYNDVDSIISFNNEKIELLDDTFEYLSLMSKKIK